MPNATGEVIGKEVSMQFPENNDANYQFTFADKLQSIAQKLNGSVAWKYISNKYNSSRTSSIQDDFTTVEKNYFETSKHIILEPQMIPPVINNIDTVVSEDEIIGKITDFTNQQGELKKSQFVLAVEPLTEEELASDSLSQHSSVIGSYELDSDSLLETTFSGLDEETDYWLYARLSNGQLPIDPLVVIKLRILDSYSYESKRQT